MGWPFVGEDDESVPRQSTPGAPADPPRPVSRARERGLGQLLSVAEQQRPAAAPAPLLAEDRWRERAAGARARGDSWLLCSVTLPDPEGPEPPHGSTVGAVLSAVQGEGWHLDRLDYVYFDQAPVQACALFRAAPAAG